MNNDDDLVPTLEAASPVDEPARSLVAALDAELRARYPVDGTEDHFHVAPGEVCGDHGVFLLARIAGVPAGCGAIRRFDANTAEVKRMYVAPEWRGRGIGRAVLAGLEREAHTRGYRRLVLETGPRQPESLAMYARAGFVEVTAFRDAMAPDLSVFMEKRLAGETGEDPWPGRQWRRR